jgi:hypothetical protein
MPTSQFSYVSAALSNPAVEEGAKLVTLPIAQS